MVRSYPVSEELAAELSKRFTHHAPHTDQPERYRNLRTSGLDLANQLCHAAPDCRERALALTKLEEALMWANAAIARNEPPPAAADQPLAEPTGEAEHATE